MDKKGLDKRAIMRDNVGNDDLYERVADKYELRLEVIKMDEQSAINDTSCKHDTLIADPSDTIGDAIAHMCANSKCGVGFYIK